jgi:multidrug efflux system membrane fusion protein
MTVPRWRIARAVPPPLMLSPRTEPGMPRQTPPPLRSRSPAARRGLLHAGLLAVLALLGAPQALAQPAPGGGGGGGIPVTAEPVRVGPEPVEIIANGIVASESVVTVRTRVDGQITRLHVQEGQMVRKGQPIVTLDSRLAEAQLAQQEAQLARDRALATRALSDMQRYQSLRGEGYAAQQRFEQAQADALAAAANARATEALMAQTRLNIEFATIAAEMDGRLGAIPLRVGNFVRQAENTAITTLTQVDPILVSFAVPERWLAEIKAAMARGGVAVRALPDQDSGPPAEGELVFVDSAVDTQTGTILLKARFANEGLRLWPGQYVGVTLIPRTDPEAISVPSAALQTGQSGRFVYIVEDGVARRRAVTLVRTLRDRVVIAGGLKPGERVIVDGAQRVQDGSRVQERGGGQPAPQRVSSAK